ncbi:MAG: glycosyltransferase family 4 protein [Chlamydiales bacterium]
MSKFCANSVLILGHTCEAGMGERVLALKLKKAIEELGFKVEPILDLFELMGSAYEPLAHLNFDLAKSDFQILEEVNHPVFKRIGEAIGASSADIFLILSWATSVAALFALGIQRKAPIAVKLQVHHRNECVLTRLYEPADLLITESLLANERGVDYGIPPGKMLYLPHYYPSICEKITPSRQYVKRLAQSQKKRVGPETVVIGMVSRLEYGKNCEFAVEAVRRLAAKGRDVVLVLKGDFPKNSPYPDYRPHFSSMLEAYISEPWLLWDRSQTSFPEVMHEYASFDVCLHLSGAEGGSHVVVEYLGLGKPVVVLNATTNPYLFAHAVLFVRALPQMKGGGLYFQMPDIEDLMEKLEEVVVDEKGRKLLAKQALKIAKERFHIDRVKQKLPLLFEPAGSSKKIERFYDEDRKLYGL